MLFPRTLMAETFDATSSAEVVRAGLNLRGQRVLVTGVSARIGVETARDLIARGAKVVGTVRNLEKAHPPVGPSLTRVKLDLASLLSIRACADSLLSEAERFDGVIANASPFF